MTAGFTWQVKLRKSGTRIPVVLSKAETQRIFEKLDEPLKVQKMTDGRYGLAARPQYGADGRVKGFASRDCASEPAGADCGAD